MEIYIGLDIGGTKVMAAAANKKGEILERIHLQTPTALQEGLDLLKDAVLQLAKERRVLAIGAAIGGPLDWEQGIVSPLHQPEWRGIPLKEIMETEFGCPFYVDVDTNIAALGEYKFGGERPERLLYMTVSTGVGGGLLMDGKIYRGMQGGHPEVGHQAIHFHCSFPERVHCDCGAPDCLEALISGTGIRRVYGKPAEQLNSDEWREVGVNLGLGIRNIACFYTPDVVVLGGGVAVGGGAKLIETAEETMRSRLNIVPAPRVRLSNLGYDTALQGTIAVAMDGL